MDEMVQVLTNQIKVKEWAGRRVITFQDIDTVHQRPRGTASRNFRENRERFIEDVDFFKIPVHELPTNFVANPSNGGNPNNLMTLLTESGYLMLAKSLTDDLAWKVQRVLVNYYFRAKETGTPEEINVSIADHDTLIQCASIMASCLEVNRPNVLNILRHIVPDIDQVQTLTVQVNDKPVTLPALPDKSVKVLAEGRIWRNPFNFNKLNKLMKERGITDSDLANRLGLSTSTVYKWRIGLNPPHKPNLAKLCNTFGVVDTYFYN